MCICILHLLVSLLFNNSISIYPEPGDLLTPESSAILISVHSSPLVLQYRREVLAATSVLPVVGFHLSSDILVIEKITGICYFFEWFIFNPTRSISLILKKVNTFSLILTNLFDCRDWRHHG